ncbi:hypothetical protein E2562_020546 [Oryza meyeriana var. granulata]|uniref:Uncharacterized protein n=1 Tax=Oryza meyeriana var. granulata TaxID=110450 RepID=A0A6G1EAW9_9ORYZ|nr:hypothetical protein E2562_020546 [Oryza meyeriana var. granulata]
MTAKVDGDRASVEANGGRDRQSLASPPCYVGLSIVGAVGFNQAVAEARCDIVKCVVEVAWVYEALIDGSDRPEAADGGDTRFSRWSAG